MGLFKKIKKVKAPAPPRITPIVHHFNPPPAPRPPKVINKIIPVKPPAKVFKPVVKPVIEIADKTNDKVIKPIENTTMDVVEKTNDKVIEPIKNTVDDVTKFIDSIEIDDDEKKKKKVKEIGDENKNPNIMPYLIIGGVLTATYMVM